MNENETTSAIDKWDVAAAIASGTVSAGLDFFWVGSWDFKRAKEESYQFFNEKVIQFAMKDPRFKDEYRKVDNKERLKYAIIFLEEHYGLPGDGDYRKVDNSGVTNKTHHLDDFCHHPTIIGLISCILVQFSKNATYYPSKKAAYSVRVEINQYNKFVSDNPAGKIFSGVINWFIEVAQTIKNRKGHLYSDIVGSHSSAKRETDGMGIPSTFLSTAKELSSFKCFEKTDFAENLRKAYQNGIGSGKKQLDLGGFNALFDGNGISNKLDMRTEYAIESELARQGIPVAINELIVRSVFFIRRFIVELKQQESVLQLTTENWKRILPFNNRVMTHMLVISSATFSAIDISSAGIKAAIKNKGNQAGFTADFIKGINYCGIGRLALSGLEEANFAFTESYQRFTELAEKKLCMLTDSIPDSKDTLKTLDNAGNMAVAVLSAGTPLGFVSATIGVYQQISEALKELELAHEDRIRIEAECAERIAIIKANREEMEQCVSAYMSEHLEVFSEALDEMDTAMENNDTDGFIGGNAKIQQKLGRDSTFSNQSEFEDIMSNDDSFKM